jgi:hypothetical protein
MMAGTIRKKRRKKKRRKRRRTAAEIFAVMRVNCSCCVDVKKWERQRGGGGGAKRALVFLLLISVTIVAAAEGNECGCSLIAPEHVQCVGDITELCYNNNSRSNIDNNKVMKLTFRDSGLSGNFTLNATLIEDRLGIDIARIMELSVRNTSIARSRIDR